MKIITTISILFMICELGASSNIYSTKVEKGLLQKLSNLENRLHIIVNIVSTESVLSSFREKSFSTQNTRLGAVVRALQAHTETTQLSVKRFLVAESIEFKSFWISNQIYIKNANLELLEKLLKFSEVERIFEEQETIIEFDSNPTLFKNVSETKANSWGIDRIRAETVWQLSQGQGITVGVIDTGVRPTHSALRSALRPTFNWFDGTGNDMEDGPNDNHGHGTHVTGTIVGGNGIGVAPRAKFISCKAGDANFLDSSVLSCAEFMFCPSRDSTKCEAPEIISNSYNSNNMAYLEPAIRAWASVYIIPVFSVGNTGPACGTALTTSLTSIFTVGATTPTNHLADFSGRGPRGFVYQPFISAPGESIISAWYTGDDQYGTASGTSQAAPHVSGTLALLLSVKRVTSSTLYTNLMNLVSNLANRGDLIPPGQNCGGMEDYVFPNNGYGGGLIDAYRSYVAWRDHGM